MLGLSLFYIFMLPTASAEGGYNFTELIDVQRVELVMVSCSLVVLVLGVAGRRYTRHTDRKTGCLYLLVLCVLFVVQSYILSGFIFFDRANLDAVIELMEERTTLELDPDRFHKLAIESRARSMQHMWNGFAHTLQDYDCSLTGTAQTDDSVVASRLLSEDPDSTRAMNVSDPLACQPTERNVVCPKAQLFGNYLKSSCVASNRLVFEDECNNCIEDFVSIWNVTQNVDVFAGDTGIIFCRCFTSTLESMASWMRSVVLLASSFLILETLMIVSMFWLVLCGPRTKQNEEESQNASTRGSDMMSEGSRRPSRDFEMEDRQYRRGGAAAAAAPAPEIGHMSSMVSDISGANYMLVEVQCPWESGPGELILVIGPDGRQSELTVPQNVRPGQYFQCEV